MKAFKRYIAPCLQRNLCFGLCVAALLFMLLEPFMGIMCFTFAAIFGISWWIGTKKMEKRIARAEKEGFLPQMLWEFHTATSVLDDKVRYSENYIFSRHSGCFFPYLTIAWMYQSQVRYLFFTFCSQLVMGNYEGKLFNFCWLKRNAKAAGEELRTLAELVYRKNPAVLLGFSAENQKKFKRRTQPGMR